MVPISMEDLPVVPMAIATIREGLEEDRRAKKEDTRAMEEGLEESMRVKKEDMRAMEDLLVVPMAMATILEGLEEDMRAKEKGLMEEWREWAPGGV